MFAFARSKQPGTTTGIVATDTGIAIASIRHQGRAGPSLQTCSFQPLAAAAADRQAQIMQGRGLDRQQCTTLLDIGEYQLLVVDAPEVPPQELRAALRWQIQDLIDFHIDDAVIDVFDAPPGGPAGTRRQMYVVVARASRVRERIDRLEQAGVNLQVIDIPELALRNIAARLPEDAAGIATLYFNPHHCLITLTHQATLYLTRTIDFGYRDLQENASQPHTLSNRLALEIQRSIDYYEQHFRQAPIRTIAILPLPVTLYGLEDALQQTLGLVTRSIALADIIGCAQEPDPAAAATCLLAVGSALRTEARTL
ncbi:MAG: pilus assembly protein PilM [Pseudomonadota bacterium]